MAPLAIGQFTISDLNDVNISTTQPANPVLNQLWLDTSLVPNQLKRWDGSKWVIVNDPADTNADVADLTTRIITVEHKVTPAEIVGVIEQATEIGGERKFAKTSDVTQALDDWTAEFSKIGGKNLIPNSNEMILSSSYLINEYTTNEDLIAGEWYTLSLKGSKPAGQEFGAWMNSGQTTVGILGHNGNGVYSITFQAPTPQTGKERKISIYQPPINTPGASVIEWIMLEKGKVQSDWTPAPGEIYSGRTRINIDGVFVGVSNSDINTHINHRGITVLDIDEPIASFGEAGAVIAQLKSESIIGDIINILPADVTFDVGPAKSIKTISAALESLDADGKRIRFLNGKKILINVYGELSDNVYINDFMGGELEIFFQPGAKLNGHITTRGNASRVIIRGASGANGTIKRVNATHPINSTGDKYIQVDRMNIDVNDGTEGGVRADKGSFVYVANCDFVRTNFAIMAYDAAQVFAIANRGNCGANAYRTSSAAIYARGTAPNCSGAVELSYGHYFASGTITKTASAYSPPAATAKTFTAIFKPKKIYTKHHGTNTISTYYGNNAAQGKWDGMANWEDACFDFGSEIAEFLEGGTNPVVKIRLHRKNTTHGPSTGVAPDPYSFSLSGFTGVNRGAWGNQVTGSPTLFPSSGTTLKFYSSVLNSGYAIWDDLEVEASVTRTV